MYKSTFRSEQRRRKVTKRFIVDSAEKRRPARQKVLALAKKLDAAAAKRSAAPGSSDGPQLVKRLKRPN
jgi:hypothetical protein